MNLKILYNWPVNRFSKGVYTMKPTTVNIFLMQRRVTQKEIAEHLGLDKSTVSLMLSGKLRLERRLDQVAQYLKISRRKLDRLIEANGVNGKKDAA